MRLRNRVEALEGSGTGAGIGELMELLDREQAGERVDWKRVPVNPVVAASLEGLDEAA